MYRFFIVALLIASCTTRQPAVHVTDSTSTTNAVRGIEGKPMRTFKGPAEILGDTAKNQRSYLKKKE